MYMALKHLSQIAAALIAAGRREDEPLAVIAHATTEKQRVLVTTLGTATAEVARSGLKPPAIVVLGEVVRLRAALDWLGALAGRRLDPDPFGVRDPERGELA
jgi:uroporphyrin-III C-methyltransferase